jgi:capsid protein
VPSKKAPVVMSNRLAEQRMRARRIEARYDAAQTTIENRRHWSFADNLSARAAHTPSILRTLRNRSRYEVANNSYARGLVDTIAEYVVGTGPRLQLLTEDDEVV